MDLSFFGHLCKACAAETVTKVQEERLRKRRSVGNEIAEKASEYLPRSLSSSAPTAATSTLTACLHRERDPSKVCLSKKKKNIHRKASRSLQLPPALHSRSPSDLRAEESSHFTDFTF